LETGMGWVTFCDSDGQFHPEDVEKLLVAASDSNADMAIGYRIARADDLKRKLMGRGWYYVARMTLWFKATKDVDCGFKLFRSQALLDYGYQLTGNHATISPEILARAYRAGHKIVEVGITHYPRKHGTQTGANLKVIFGSFMELLRVQKTLPSLTARKA
jgi:glycosyltransferase involved in cell wall biosynthesis